MQNEPERSKSIEALLEEQLELTRDTNDVVHGIDRMMRVSFWVKVVFWIVVLVLPFFLIKPFLNAFFPADENGFFSELQAIPSSADIEKAIELYRGTSAE